MSNSPIPPDHTGRERRAVALRRLALDELVGVPTCDVDVLIATRRPRELGAAVARVTSQRSVRPRLLIGLHGDGWPETDVDLGLPAGAVVRRHPTTTTLGGVLGDLCDHAVAPLVTKWDDDDWYGRDHLSDLVRAYEYSGADIVGKAAEFVRLEGSDVTIRRYDIGAESYSWTLAGGTLLMGREWLASIGGWPDVAVGVDRALLEQAKTSGARGYRTHGFQYVLRRQADGGHTWLVPDERLLATATEVRRGLDLDFAGIEPDAA